MSEQQNCILTAKDVGEIQDRMKKVQALARGNYRIYEHCRMVGQTLRKGQRKVARMEAAAAKPVVIELDADTLKMLEELSKL